MNTKKAVLASAVASLFLSGAAFAAKDAPKKATVKCAGINSCAGKGSCSGADNSCSGKNSCGGKGWTATATEKECKDKKGTVITAKADAAK
jgi:hypothetical protein